MGQGRVNNHTRFLGNGCKSDAADDLCTKGSITVQPHTITSDGSEIRK